MTSDRARWRDREGERETETLARFSLQIHREKREKKRAHKRDVRANLNALGPSRRGARQNRTMEPKRRREKGVPGNDDDDDDDDPKNATTPSGGGKTEKTGRAHLIAHDDDDDDVF